MATNEQRVYRQILDQVLEKLVHLPLDLTPPQVGKVIHSVVREVTHNSDPYHQVKVKYNKLAMTMYPRLKSLVATSKDPLRTAVNLSILGNIIDFGATGSDFDVEQSLETLDEMAFGVDDYEGFKKGLENTQTLLYLGDNAGEIVFDKLLIEEILRWRDLEITFVVKEAPIINDATMEDAESIGMTDLVRVVSNGANPPSPATVLSECSEEINELFERSDLIISKGQGNFEVLEDKPRDIFFLLKAKCPVIARQLEVKAGDFVIKRHRACYHHTSDNSNKILSHNGLNR